MEGKLMTNCGMSRAHVRACGSAGSDDAGLGLPKPETKPESNQQCAESELIGMWRLLEARFARSIERHYESPTTQPRFSIARLISGTCPHLRDRIRKFPFTSYGPAFDVGHMVYVHANAPEIRYCHSCSTRARRNFGDEAVCGLCHETGAAYLRELRHPRDELGHFICILPLCDECNAIIGPVLSSRILDDERGCAAA